MLEAHRTDHAENSYELAYPIYRVNFWERTDEMSAWKLDAHYLTGVDSVLEALAWVHRHARGRRFELFVEAGDNRTSGARTAPLVRLAGTNPNEPSPVTGALRTVSRT